MTATQTIRRDCGNIELNVSGKPMARGICHCLSCQALYNAAFHAGAVWPASGLTITHGQAAIKDTSCQTKNCDATGAANVGLSFSTGTYSVI